MAKLLVAFSLPIFMILHQALPSKADGNPCKYKDGNGDIHYVDDGTVRILGGIEKQCVDGQWMIR